jgi:hypothetical protein
VSEKIILDYSGFFWKKNKFMQKGEFMSVFYSWKNLERFFTTITISN